MIADLEKARSGLVAKKMGLERKIEQLEERVAGKRGAVVDGGGKGRGV